MWNDQVPHVGKPKRVTVCHCTFCQRRTGGAVSIHVSFDENGVALTGTEIATYEQRSDESNCFLRLHFCKLCATTAMLTLEKRPSFRLITEGTLNDPKSVEVDFQFGGGRANRGSVFPRTSRVMKRRRRQAQSINHAELSARHRTR